MGLANVALSVLVVLVVGHLILRLVALLRGPPFPRLSPPRRIWTDPQFLENLPSLKDLKTYNSGGKLRVAITGGSGFLGRYVCRELVEAGHEVVVLDVVPPKTVFLAEMESTFGEHCLTFVRINLADPSLENELAIAESLRGVDVLIHAAGVVNMSYRAFPLLYNVHVVGTTVILNSAIRAGVESLVYISSAAIIFNKKRAMRDITEDSPLPDWDAHASYYAITKRMAEEIVNSAFNALNKGIPGKGTEGSGNLRFKTVILRPPALYGVDDGMAAEKLLNREVPGNPSPGGKQNWLYVKNAAYALRLAAEKLARNAPDVAGEVFYIGDDGPVLDMNTFWNQFFILEGKGYRLKNIPYSLSILGAMVSEGLSLYLCDLVNLDLFQFNRQSLLHIVSEANFSIAKAKKCLGYSPPYSCGDAFREMLSEHEKRMKLKS